MTRELTETGLSGKIRSVTDKDGRIWYLARDICLLLKMKSSGTRLASLAPEPHYQILRIPLNGVMRECMFLTEQGVVSVLLHSRKVPNSVKESIIQQISDARSILNALNDFEIPDDLPDMYIYAIQEAETKRVKIGISRDPQMRLKQLQTGNSQELVLIASRKAENRFKDESLLHRENRDLRVRGEWFQEGTTIYLT